MNFKKIISSNKKNESNLNNTTCEKHNEKSEPNRKFCPVYKSINKDNGNLYIKIIIISNLISIIANLVLKNQVISFKLYILSFYITILTIITGKIKCPNNKFIKTLFWIMIIIIVIIIIVTIQFLITCFDTIESCTGSSD